MPGPMVFDERVGGGEQTLEPRLAGAIKTPRGPPAKGGGWGWEPRPLTEGAKGYPPDSGLSGRRGGPPRVSPAGRGRARGPGWPPDGTGLAFLSGRAPKNKPQLYVIPADGGEP